MMCRNQTASLSRQLPLASDRKAHLPTEIGVSLPSTYRWRVEYYRNLSAITPIQQPDQTIRS